MSHQLVSIVVDFIRSFIRIIGFRLHHAQAFSPTLNREIDFRVGPHRDFFSPNCLLGHGGSTHTCGCVFRRLASLDRIHLEIDHQREIEHKFEVPRSVVEEGSNAALL